MVTSSEGTHSNFSYSSAINIGNQKVVNKELQKKEQDSKDNPLSKSDKTAQKVEKVNKEFDKNDFTFTDACDKYISIKELLPNYQHFISAFNKHGLVVFGNSLTSIYTPSMGHVFGPVLFYAGKNDSKLNLMQCSAISHTISQDKKGKYYASCIFATSSGFKFYVQITEVAKIIQINGEKATEVFYKDHYQEKLNIETVNKDPDKGNSIFSSILNDTLGSQEMDHPFLKI